MIIDQDIYLEHFGVKGMQWGVRRKDRSRQGHADKLTSYAQRRPTRGNVRKAQRAQRVADIHEKRLAKLGGTPEERRAARTSRLVGMGAGIVSGMFLAGRTGSLVVATIGGTGTGLIGSKIVKEILEKDRHTTVKALRNQSK